MSNATKLTASIRPFFRLPRRFLGMYNLRTGVELITMFTILNKAAGFYGFLAVFTGAQISAWQMSMYVYSILAAVFFSWCLKNVQREKPLPTLVYAYAFVVDSIINIAYTVMFATTWFLILSKSSSTGAGDKMVQDVAGFTDPAHTVEEVHVVPTPGATGENADLAVTPSSIGVPGVGKGVLQPESLSSIMAICFFWAVKAYFVLVVLSYAKQVVKDHGIGQERSFSAGETPSMTLERWLTALPLFRSTGLSGRSKYRRSVSFGRA
ncbi:DUF1753-domain-containing protein [Saitoella complicata NRRL Y-17804]|nr:DUF1753-domain-containing protein [Saitoella complicata NRRL Y-17804]ODQ56070.1 DUF1753-domain-containing protein [Saitoella complicata NRRL Y-17804]